MGCQKKSAFIHDSPHLFALLQYTFQISAVGIFCTGDNREGDCEESRSEFESVPSLNSNDMRMWIAFVSSPAYHTFSVLVDLHGQGVSHLLLLLSLGSSSISEVCGHIGSWGFLGF